MYFFVCLFSLLLSEQEGVISAALQMQCLFGIDHGLSPHLQASGFYHLILSENILPFSLPLREEANVRNVR